MEPLVELFIKSTFRKNVETFKIQTFNAAIFAVKVAATDAFSLWQEQIPHTLYEGTAAVYS